MPRSPRFLLLASLLALAACKPDAAVRKSEVIGRGTIPNAGPSPSEPRDAAGAVPNLDQQPAPSTGPTGSVSGTIAFSGKPPAPVLIDTSMDPACGFGPAKVYSEQFAVTAGKLGNVFVYVKSGPPAAMQASPASAAPAVLDQKGCQYTPHVLGVMAGGFVSFHNSDPTMHNIHTMPTAVGNETIDVSQGPRGQPENRQFQHPELMIPVRCNNHPWMNAFINVSETPFFAVTDASGHFTLRGLPPGDYVLGAVHEKLGEKTISLTIHPNTPTKADFTFAQPH